MEKDLADLGNKETEAMDNDKRNASNCQTS